MEDDEWVLVRRSAEKYPWNPSLMEDSNGESTSRPLKVMFRGPAKYWTDAIPIGNGRLGAMIWGGVASDTLQLNEDTLWTGIPGDYTNPNAPQALSEVKKLVDNGQYAEATTAAEKLSGNQSELNGQPFVMVDKFFIFRSTTASIQLHNFDSKMRHRLYVKGENRIVIEGSCPGNKYSRDDSPKGIQFGAILDLQISEARGVVHVLDDTKLKVEGSDWAVLLLVSSSSFDGPFTKPNRFQKEPYFRLHECVELIEKFIIY